MRRPIVALLALTLCAPLHAGTVIEGARLPGEDRAVRSAMETLDLWLDANTDLPRAQTPVATVRLVDPGVPVRFEGRMTVVGDTVRGLYDAGTATITLVRQWTGETPSERAVLLHEMIHHRQVGARHWYCPQAMEWDAYRIQDDFLAAHGLALDVNWTWVLLASSCAVRDHHPD